MKLDLHGLPIHEAWQIFNNKIADAYHMNFKYVIVVTGQGQIMKFAYLQLKVSQKEYHLESTR